MADLTEPDSKVFRPGGLSYIELPTRQVEESAEFYRTVFGWQLSGNPQSPGFSDGTGHVIGHWRTDLAAVGWAGVIPYIYVDQLDGTLQCANQHGAQTVEPPYPEGDLWVATIRDPAGNIIGIWQRAPRRS
jgi:uncharacterized protein